jgi:A nuclease of the HNH/ENDO VII superfamily with conserved WHH
MSAQAKAHDAEIRKAEGELGELNKELKLDLVQAGVDAAGTVDPTPVSDLVGAGISIYRGDFIGAGLSLISMIPYAGDALGKTAKGARVLKKMNALRKKIALVTERINVVRKQSREAASAAARARKQAQAAKKSVDDAACVNCPKPKVDLDNPFDTRSPTNGWSGVRGDSAWTPDASTSYGKDVLEWQKKHGMPPGTPIQFREGFPDFSPYAIHKVKIDMKGDPSDFTAANNAMKEIDPNWKQPQGMTWHHSEDGTTMMLVPTEINSIPHTGGNALVKAPGF